MTLFLISIGVLAFICISMYLMVKWHDKVKEDAIKRAIDGGCPYFTQNDK